MVRRKSQSHRRRRSTGNSGRRLTFMHPYSRSRKKISLVVDHYRITKNGRRQAVAYDSHGNEHYQFVKDHGSHKRRSHRRRSRH
jgi:hypothetical protein